MLEFNSRNFKILSDQNSQLKEKLKFAEDRQDATLKENARLIEQNESHRIVIYQQQSSISSLEETINALKLELESLRGLNASGNSNLMKAKNLATPTVSSPYVTDQSSIQGKGAAVSISTTTTAQISLGSKHNSSLMGSSINAFEGVRSSTTSLVGLGDQNVSRYCSTMHMLSRDDSLNDLSNSRSQQTRVGSPKNVSTNQQPYQSHKKSQSSIFNNSTKNLAPPAFQNTLGSKRQVSTEATSWIAPDSQDEQLSNGQMTPIISMKAPCTGQTNTTEGQNNNSHSHQPQQQQQQQVLLSQQQQEQQKTLSKVLNTKVENSKKTQTQVQQTANGQKHHFRSGSCLLGQTQTSNTSSQQMTPNPNGGVIAGANSAVAATGAAPRLGSSASQSNYSSLTVLKSAMFSQQQSNSSSSASTSQSQLQSVSLSKKQNQQLTNKKDQGDRLVGQRQGATTPTASLSIHQSSTSNLLNVNSTYSSVSQTSLQKFTTATISNNSSSNKENGYYGIANKQNSVPSLVELKGVTGGYSHDEDSDSSINFKSRFNSNSNSNRSTFNKTTPSFSQSSSTSQLVQQAMVPSPFLVKQQQSSSISPLNLGKSTNGNGDVSMNQQVSDGSKTQVDEDALGMYRVSKKEPMLLKKPTSHSFFRQQSSNGSSQTNGFQNTSVSSSIDYNQYKMQRKQTNGSGGGSQANVSGLIGTATTTIDLSRNSSLSQHVPKAGGGAVSESGISKEQPGQTFGSIAIKGKQLWGDDENYLTLNEEQPQVNCNYFSTKPGQLNSLLPPSSRQELVSPIMGNKNSISNQASSGIASCISDNQGKPLVQQYSLPQNYGNEGQSGIRCDTSGMCDISFVQPLVNQNLEFKVKSKSSSNLNKEPGRLKQHLEGAAGFGKVRAESIYSKEPAVIADRIFESFYVFGVDKNHINKATNIPQLLTPKVEMRFPEDQVYSENRENVLPLFAFPKGVETQRVRMSDSLSQMNEVMFANYVVENNPNCFTFVIKSDDSFKRAHETSSLANGLLAQCNPSRLLYGICFKINDLIEDSQVSTHTLVFNQLNLFVNQVNEGNSKSTNNQSGYWVSKKALCFVTYYPFMKFFLNIISYFLNQLKMERISSDNISNPCQTDTHLLMKVMASTGVDLLRNLQSLATPSIGASVRLYHMTSCFEYQVPNAQQARYIEAEEHSSTVFQCIPCETFVRIFLSVLTEQPMVIVSQNQSLLSAAVLFIYSLLKPLKWPHPLITSLPNSLIHLLDSPVPIFLGLNMSKQDVMSKGLFQRYEYCSFVFLDEQHKRVESFHNDFDQFARNSLLYAKFVDALQPIFLEISMNKSASNSTIGLIGSLGVSNLRKTTRTQSAIFQTGNQSRLDSSKTLAGSTSTATSNDLGTSCASRVSSQQQGSHADRERELSGQFMNVVSRLIQQEILDYLPTKNQLGFKKDVIDFEIIEKFVRNKFPKFDSDPLLSRVMGTQMFSYFLEEHYLE